MGPLTESGPWHFLKSWSLERESIALVKVPALFQLTFWEKSLRGLGFAMVTAELCSSVGGGLRHDRVIGHLHCGQFTGR